MGDQVSNCEGASKENMSFGPVGNTKLNCLPSIVSLISNIEWHLQVWSSDETVVWKKKETKEFLVHRDA